MSYALYIGKNHTSDGIAYLAGYGDEPSSHWLGIYPARHRRAGELITVGVTESADLPGRPTEIERIADSVRNLRVEYSFYKGVPSPLTNGGLNEFGVAVRDVWSPSRPELIAMTKPDQTGPNYSDLARLVVEQARSAREGVELIGRMIAEHGYSTYGGNSHLIADPEEAWVVIEFAGSQGLWVAERLGADSIRASRPGYIGNVDIDDPSGERFLFSENLVSFARTQGWYGKSETEFDVNKIYGDGRLRWDGVEWIEDEMQRRAKRDQKVSFADIAWAMRTERLTGDTAGYGQIVPLLKTGTSQTRMVWHTQTGAISAPFSPVFLGTNQIPEEFQCHRYLTTGESARFEDTRHAIDDGPHTVSTVPQGIESTRSAFAVFKRLQYLILQRPEFLEEVVPLWEAREQQLLEMSRTMSDAAVALIESSHVKEAESMLTYFSCNELMNALDLGEKLAASLEAKTRLHYGISRQATPNKFDQIW